MIIIQGEQIIEYNDAFVDLVNFNSGEINFNVFSSFSYFHFLNTSLGDLKDIYYKLLYNKLLYYEDIIKIEIDNVDEITENNFKEKTLWLKLFAIPIRYQDKPAVQVSIMDITESKKEEEEVFRLKRNLEIIQGIAKLSIVEWDLKNNFIWTSEIYNILELDETKCSSDCDLLDKFVIDEEKSKFELAKENTSSENPIFNEIFTVKTAKGNIKYIYIHFILSYHNSEIKSFVGFVQDITEEMKDKNKIKTNLNDKEALLREVHHRVKNNLQIILSLLTLDLKFNPDNPKNTIEKMEGRIRSMASMHEKFYQSADLSSVNFTDYLKSTINYLFELNNISNIQIISDLEELSLNMELAIPLGLIVNEIFSNIIRYAFPNGEEGHLRLVLKENNRKITLIIGDDGVGLPDDLDIYSSSSLGFILINQLVDQINGEFVKLDETGTVFKIEFFDKVFNSSEEKGVIFTNNFD